MIWKDDDLYLERIKDEKDFGVFLDMGIGKTSLLLALINYKMFFDENIKRILIIAPKSVTLSVWQDEIEKFENFRHMRDKIELIDGDVKTRIKKLNSDKSIHIISSSMIDWLYGDKEKIPYVDRKTGKTKYRVKWTINTNTPNYDFIIVDECSQFKDVTTFRFKAFEKIIGDSELFLLSGTPFPNTRKKIYKTKDGREFPYYEKPDELYYLLFLLKLYKGSLYDFRKEFCYANPWSPHSYQMHVEVYNEIIDLLHTKSITEELKLNIKMHEKVVYCKTDEKMQELKRDFEVQVNQFDVIDADNTAIMINKSLQLSNGFMYDSFGSTFRFNDFKFKKMLEVLEKIGNENVIIFYNFTEDCDYILKNLKGSKLYETEEDKTNWNNGKIKYLLLSFNRSTFGLNLQFGGHNMILFGLIWSAEKVTQGIRRLYRKGQKNDVNIWILLSNDGYDKYVYNVVVAKKQTTSDFKSMVVNKAF